MRQKARRHAHVRIRNGLDVDRRQPTDDEIQDLLEGISRNAVPKFGLVKLSAMRLDDGVEPPAWFERIIRWPKGELIPMVHLAALRRRDAILVQLLRAGAAPFTRLGDDDDGDHDEEETLSRRARTFLAGLRTPHATWLVVVAAHMRLRAVAASQAVCRNDREPAPADVCNRCGQTGHWAKDCERPKNANAPLRESRTEPNASDVCNGCGGTGHWFRDCPAAAERVKGERRRTKSMLGVQDRRAESPDDVRRVRPRGVRAVRVASPARQVRATRRRFIFRRRFGERRGRGPGGDSPGGGYTGGCGVDVSGVHRARSIRRARRRRRRLGAAIRVGAGDDRGGVQTSVARALPGGEAAERRRGPEKRKVVQEVRRLGSPGVRAAAAWHLSAEAHRGSHRRGSAGDARRIRAIVAAGCDVNCSDEYGLTPLMWAGGGAASPRRVA